MTIFFDLDGPILDVSQRYYKTYSDLLEHFNATPISKDDYWQAKRLSVPDDAILDRSGISHLTATYQAMRIERIESSRYLAFDILWPGVLTLLKQISIKEQLVLVTLRRNREALERELEQLKIDYFFAHILSESAEGKSKPQTKIDLVKSVFATDLIQGFFIGDTQTDIIAGKGLGLKTVATTFGIRDQSLLAPLGPDFLISAPNDLIAFFDPPCRGSL